MHSVDLVDDAMNPTSSRQNPDTGTEKPEVAAYGSSTDRIRVDGGSFVFRGLKTTTMSAPWVGIEDPGTAAEFEGTSFATPFVAGFAALCIDKFDGLKDEPQGLKAMIMVSGLAQNVEGSARLSDEDGVGVAKATAANCSYWIGPVEYSDFGPDGGLDFLPTGRSVRLVRGEKLRIAMVYTHPPRRRFANPATDPYDRSDLDLCLKVGDEIVARSNYGEKNPFEIIDYVPRISGSGRLIIHCEAGDWDVDVADLRVAVAWAHAKWLDLVPGPSPP